jgi:multidrug efflux system membrane fusion protein
MRFRPLSIVTALAALVCLSTRTSSATKETSTDSAIPVVVAEVQRRDLPRYLDGLGRAQALNTVAVRAQVDGEITQVAFNEGQAVRAGELLVQIDPRPYQAALDQALGRRDQDAAQLASAEKTLERDAGLLGKALLDQQTVDLQQSTVAQLQAQLRSDEAAVSTAKIQLEHTRIVAPMDGRTGMRLVDHGNVVRGSEATVLVVITELQPISVMFTLPEKDFPQVNEAAKQGATGQPLTVLAQDRDNRRTIDEGTLTAVDNQIDETSGTIKLKAVFENHEQNLWPGQFVNIRLLVSRQKDALVVPASAIQQGPDGNYVYVITADATATMRPVKVGPTEGGFSLIESGLAEREKVVVDGHYLLQPNVRVSIKTPVVR